jgi:hypothetical protein
MNSLPVKEGKCQARSAKKLLLRREYSVASEQSPAGALWLGSFFWHTEEAW